MFSFSGGKGIRTPDLLIANETLYQLSYTPQKEGQLSWRKDFSASDSENVTRDSWRWIVDAHREGRRYIVHSEELLSAFLELEATLL